MTRQYATASELRRTLSAEFLNVAGLPGKGLLQALARPIVWPPTHRFSRLAAEFDRQVAQFGLGTAARWVLPHFVEGVRAYGVERIPTSGPLIIASNHPGGFDGLVVTACLPRDDLKVVVTGRPFFRAMVGTAPHLIYTPPPSSPDRMMVVREAIRHLRAGGALLIFANGQVEPDPAVLPGAEDSLPRWSQSLSILARRVPGVRLLVTVVSGVLAPSCLQHPLVRRRQDLPLKQILAEFLQISQQMVLGRRFGLKPAVRFAEPLLPSEVDGGQEAPAALAAVVARAKGLLADLRSEASARPSHLAQEV